MQVLRFISVTSSSVMNSLEEINFSTARSRPAYLNSYENLSQDLHQKSLIS